MVVETALRQAAMDRRLTTLETVDAHTGAGRLAFAAATCGFAFARADAAADAHFAMTLAGVAFEFIELHIFLPFSLRFSTFTK